VTESTPVPSARKQELLDAAYGYALTHGLADLSLRPLAAAIGSSPRVLLYLFGSKEGLVAALLARARHEETALLDDLRARIGGEGLGLADTVGQVWSWLAEPRHRAVLTLWVEAYARSLVEPEGAWAGFARATVEDWLGILATAQSAAVRGTAQGRSERTNALAVLRGALLDLLATGDDRRVTAAVVSFAATIDVGDGGRKAPRAGRDSRSTGASRH
jgi:AcrR family transcriptional regulator